MDDATFSLYAPDMRRAAEISARAAGCDAFAAEDVASETMLSMWMMRDRIQTSTCVAYARVAARHKALNALRDRPGLERLEDNSPPRIAQPSAEEALIAKEDVEWLLRQIDALPPTQQAILRLRQVQMLETAEIALRLGIAETSVSTLLSRARKTMYNAIKQRMKQ